MPHPIRVLLVEDSPVVLIILKRLLATAPEIEVVGTARNGLQALALIPEVQPMVICTDYHMPQMNGLEFTQEVMSRFPCPILVISTSVHPQENESNIFRLLEAGAVDIFPKPNASSAMDYDSLRLGLINKIKVLAGVKVFTRHTVKMEERRSKREDGRQEAENGLGTRRRGDAERKKPNDQLPLTNNLIQNSKLSSAAARSTTQNSIPTPHTPHPTPYSPLPTPSIKAIAIGASTGGPQALQTLLSQLPANLSIPVFCVQHISEGFLQGLVNWLAAACPLPIKIAQAGELPLPGVVYFAPERSHLELGRLGQFVCSSSTPIDGHCPSVTVLFQAAARRYGSGLIGVLLTGMGKDGAAGMLEIALAGGTTIAQDEQSSVVFGMPKEAIALGAAKHVLSIQTMPLFLSKFF